MSDNPGAVVFPGQGSQRPGMGKDFYDNVPISRSAYDEASDALGWDVAALCFGDDEKLNLTEYAQPCILATEIAMFRGLQTLYGFDPAYYGGHSLGEYAALIASGVMPFPDALKIVQTRGRLMQEATPVGMGGMAAVIADGLEAQTILTAVEGLPVDLANDNSANQVVISGELGAIPEAETRIRASLGDAPSFRFVPLNVSAPFHSRFMAGIESPFRDVLQNAESHLNSNGAAQVTSNFTGGFHSESSSDIVDRMVSQLSNTVQWRKNMLAIANVASSIFEIGPGRPLRGFFKTMDLECYSIITFSAAQRMFEESGDPQDRL